MLILSTDFSFFISPALVRPPFSRKNPQNISNFSPSTPACRYECRKEQSAVMSTHRPVPCSEVLQCSRRRLQGVVIVTAGEKSEVKPHHLRLVQQLQPWSTQVDDTLDVKEHAGPKQLPPSDCKRLV